MGYSEICSRPPPTRSYSKANLGITHTESLFAGYFQYEKVLEISVRSQMERSVSDPSDWNIRDHNIPTESCRSILTNTFIVLLLFSYYTSIFPLKSLLVRSISSSCCFWMYKPTLKTHEDSE